MLLKLNAIPTFTIQFRVIIIIGRRCVVKNTAEVLHQGAVSFLIFVCFKTDFCQISSVFYVQKLELGWDCTGFSSRDEVSGCYLRVLTDVRVIKSRSAIY